MLVEESLKMPVTRRGRSASRRVLADVSSSTNVRPPPEKPTSVTTRSRSGKDDATKPGTKPSGRRVRKRTRRVDAEANEDSIGTEDKNANASAAKQRATVESQDGSAVRSSKRLRVTSHGTEGETAQRRGLRESEGNIPRLEDEQIEPVEPADGSEQDGKSDDGAPQRRSLSSGELLGLLDDAFDGSADRESGLVSRDVRWSDVRAAIDIPGVQPGGIVTYAKRRRREPGSKYGSRHGRAIPAHVVPRRDSSSPEDPRPLRLHKQPNVTQGDKFESRASAYDNDSEEDVQPTRETMSGDEEFMPDVESSEDDSEPNVSSDENEDQDGSTTRKQRRGKTGSRLTEFWKQQRDFWSTVDEIVLEEDDDEAQYL